MRWFSCAVAAVLTGSALVLVCSSSFAASATAAQQADWCKRLSPRLPGVSAAECQHSGLQPSGAISRKGFPILVRSMPAAKAGKGAVRVLLLGGIHGDELTAAAIVFEWMQWMQTGTAQQFQWKVAPVLNPDGLLAPKPQRVNANGVDLNRNFPTPGWQKDAPQYWMRVTGKDPRRFPGASPLSEPESRWLNEEIEAGARAAALWKVVLQPGWRLSRLARQLWRVAQERASDHHRTAKCAGDAAV